MLQVFEKGNFAGLDEMKRNPRLFDRVAPMGVADIAMAVSYKFVQRAPLSMPVTAFDGTLDYTIAPGNIAQWSGYTSAAFRNVPVAGDHYFVASHYRQVRHAVSETIRVQYMTRQLDVVAHPDLYAKFACSLLRFSWHALLCLQQCTAHYHNAKRFDVVHTLS